MPVFLAVLVAYMRNLLATGLLLCHFEHGTDTSEAVVHFRIAKFIHLPRLLGGNSMKTTCPLAQGELLRSLYGRVRRFLYPALRQKPNLLDI
jgi:hypothetical protein